MLTIEQKARRMAWAHDHINTDWDHINTDWDRIIFTDESAFQMFRNTIKKWHKSDSEFVQRCPKDKSKIMVWGGISLL